MIAVQFSVKRVHLKGPDTADLVTTTAIVGLMKILMGPRQL